MMVLASVFALLLMTDPVMAGWGETSSIVTSMGDSSQPKLFMEGEARTLTAKEKSRFEDVDVEGCTVDELNFNEQGLLQRAVIRSSPNVQHWMQSRLSDLSLWLESVFGPWLGVNTDPSGVSPSDGFYVNHHLTTAVGWTAEKLDERRTLYSSSVTKLTKQKKTGMVIRSHQEFVIINKGKVEVFERETWVEKKNHWGKVIERKDFLTQCVFASKLSDLKF